MNTLLVLSITLLLGFAGSQLTRRFKFPSVVGYLFIGLLLGPSFLNVFDPDIIGQYDIISEVTLGLVAFTIGSEMHSKVLKRQGKSLAAIILLESFAAFMLVTIFIYWLTHKWYIALLFGAMAPASAPAGTVAVLKEYKAKGPLTSTLLSVVGLDDGLAIIIYGFASAIAKNMIIGEKALGLKEFLMGPAWEIIASIMIGALIGFLFTLIAKKLKSDKDILIVTLGAIFLCCGLSNLLHLSLILTNLTLGLVLTNLYLHGARKSATAIEALTGPIFVIFFVLAGAHLKLSLLPSMGLIGILYIIGRIIGLMGGSYAGACISRADKNVRRYLGLGILSQAGVAIGLALIVVKEFSPLGPKGAHVSTLIINTIAATTIFFEILGPITTKIAITKSQEIGKLE
jgi:Kef-type K+ transport system membrane component KefB